MLSGVLFNCIFSLVLYYAGSGVKSVQVVLSELSISLLDLVKAWSCAGTVVWVFLLSVCCSNCDVICICYELCVFTEEYG